jgi:flagellar protein FlbD
MIKVTRLNGEAITLNAQLIRSVESKPDTFLVMSSGERMIVKEQADEVVRLIGNYFGALSRR